MTEPFRTPERPAPFTRWECQRCAVRWNEEGDPASPPPCVCCDGNDAVVRHQAVIAPWRGVF